jgi:hypothetical protein
MPPETSELVDLLDLKMLPAWVKEPSGQDYSEHSGEEDTSARRDERHRGRSKRDRSPRSRPPPGKARTHPTQDRHRQHRQERNREAAPPRPLAEIRVRFLPQSRALESVAAQIKADAFAYSLFSLARLFLQKAERYDVHLQPKPESRLYQLGESGEISADKQFLENNAFRFAQKEFYKIDITQSEPVKGNFTRVARDRLSGTLLGPTNHHGYQPRLRSLYEQRFSRRMSFADYQRQIEIVSDPALVEQWKEELRTVTTFTTLRDEPPLTFNSAAEAERHFCKTYLPGLVHAIEEIIIDGPASRNLADRTLRRLVENAWTMQNRSPSQMMQELAGRFREVGLHIFRHRRGMLFVSPIRVRAFAHEQTSVSPQVEAILNAIRENPRINRKDLAEKLIVRPGESVPRRIDLAGEEAEPRKLALASDLRWLISEGYVIEFNDGSLDLPRTKPKAAVEAAVSAAKDDSVAKDESEFAASTDARPTNTEL